MKVDYAKTCFVIMPFGEKEVGATKVDFDGIYHSVFEPAIKAAVLREGGQLNPVRTDKEFHTGHISQEMFEYIEYSRIALADITGLNANVFYELGHRHRAMTAGTITVRQTDAPIPFDINQIKAFMYEYQPEKQAADSRELITRILNESLARVAVDSPIRLALDRQQAGSDEAESLLFEAEEAIRNDNTITAIEKYKAAAVKDPANPLTQMRLGLLLKDDGRWDKAKGCFEAAIRDSSAYVEAYRELGIAENKLATAEERKQQEPPGLSSLDKAIALDNTDFDAQASRGGILKRAGRLKEAREAYDEATKASNGHPYPLLNALTLHAHLNGKLDQSSRARRRLKQAVRARGAQFYNKPSPLDSPWSLFDLAQAHLMLNEDDKFLELLDAMEGLKLADWQIETFLSTLEMLVPAQAQLPSLQEGLDRLRAEL